MASKIMWDLLLCRRITIEYRTGNFKEGPSGNVSINREHYDEIRDRATGGRTDEQMVRDALDRYYKERGEE